MLGHTRRIFINRTSLCLVLLVFLLFSACGASPTKAIVGKWLLADSKDDLMEFFEDGTMMLGKLSKPEKATGTWTYYKDGRLKVVFSYESQTTVLLGVLKAVDANHFTISELEKNDMVLTNKLDFTRQHFGDVEVRGDATKCLSNAKQIGTACIIYAADHKGAFPKDLNELVPDYLPDRAIFSSALAPKPGQMDYEYFGAGSKDSAPADKILLRGRFTTKDGKRSVVRFNGSGKSEQQ